ncbi:hypothetical protein V1525DRAFT_410574 [Lipomyces kononenkoae]|uniref:Uncharacterized protein n=1 Tax=Lipomyces kononenkoae TaxID=34357 RepID=A0ACC3SUF8_LIPKO
MPNPDLLNQIRSISSYPAVVCRSLLWFFGTSSFSRFWFFGLPLGTSSAHSCFLCARFLLVVARRLLLSSRFALSSSFLELTVSSSGMPHTYLSRGFSCVVFLICFFGHLCPWLFPLLVL